MYVITIDIDKCQGCGDCVETCPNEILALVEQNGKKYAMVSGDPEECIGCLSCEAECDEGALTVTGL